MFWKSRGQISIIGLIYLLVALIVFAGMQPILTDLINTLLPGVDTMTQAILRLFIPMVAIGILLSFLMYVIPQRQTPGY